MISGSVGNCDNYKPFMGKFLPYRRLACFTLLPLIIDKLINFKKWKDEIPNFWEILISPGAHRRRRQRRQEAEGEARWRWGARKEAGALELVRGNYFIREGL